MGVGGEKSKKIRWMVRRRLGCRCAWGGAHQLVSDRARSALEATSLGSSRFKVVRTNRLAPVQKEQKANLSSPFV